MKKKNTNKTYKRGKSGNSGGSIGMSGEQAPVTTASALRLKGGKQRNMSLTKVSAMATRPPYPHILEAGTSELINSTQSGLSGSWIATFINARKGASGARDYQAFMEYTMGDGNSESTEKMVARLGLQRPMCYEAIARAGFYNDNGQNGLASLALPWDGLIPQEEWLMEFSREMGMAMAWRRFNVDVSNIFHSQRLYGKYGMTDDHTKASGNPYTPFERLHDTLYACWDRTELGIPSHLLENMTLGDIVIADTAMLTDVVPGMTADTWVNQHAIILHKDAFEAGAESLDFGTIMDNDNNLRYLVQPPTGVTFTDQYGSNVEANSCVHEVMVLLKDIITKPDGTAITYSDLPTCTMGGVELSELPGSLRFIQSLFTDAPGDAENQAVYKPLSGDWSSWAVPELLTDLRQYNTYGHQNNHASRVLTPNPETLLLGSGSIDLSYTRKMWQLRGAELRNWCLAVGRVLTPEFLATNFPRVGAEGFVVTGGASVGEGFDMATLTDMINWNAEFAMNFNPIKQTPENNGPFAENRTGLDSDTWQERYWLARPLVGGRSYEKQKELLQVLFSKMQRKTGVGYTYTDLPSYFALLNPRWLEVLFKLGVPSSVKKRERYVALPAGRTGSQATLFSTEDATTAAKHLTAIYARIFGSFRCRTTAPLSDVDYTWSVDLSNGFRTEFHDSVTPGFPSGSFVEVPAFKALGTKLNLKPAWDTSRSDEGASMSFKRSGRDGYEKNLVFDGTVSVDVGSVLESQLRSQHGAFLGLAGVVSGETGGNAATVDVFTANLIYDGEEGNDSGSVRLKEAVAGSGALVETVELSGIEVLESFEFGADNAKEFYDSVAAKNYPFHGLVAAGWESDDALAEANGARNVDWTYTLYKATISKAAMGLDAGSTIHFQTQGFSCEPNEAVKVRALPMQAPVPAPGFAVWWDTANSRSTFPETQAAPLVVVNDADNGLVAQQFPDQNGTDVAYTPQTLDIARWALWYCFNFVSANGHRVTVGTDEHWAIPFTAATTTGYVEGGDDSNAVWGDGSVYLTPQNEDVFYEQRRFEFDASIYAYSNGVYVPAVLNRERGHYAYHGDLQGFMRDKLVSLLPDQVEHMRLSVNPYTSDSATVMRVVKEFYTPFAYQQMYKQLEVDAADAFTGITPEEFLRVQQTLVRSGQSVR